MFEDLQVLIQQWGVIVLLIGIAFYLFLRIADAQLKQKGRMM